MSNNSEIPQNITPDNLQGQELSSTKERIHEIENTLKDIQIEADNLINNPQVLGKEGAQIVVALSLKNFKRKFQEFHDWCTETNTGHALAFACNMRLIHQSDSPLRTLALIKAYFSSEGSAEVQGLQALKEKIELLDEELSNIKELKYVIPEILSPLPKEYFEGVGEPERYRFCASREITSCSEIKSAIRRRLKEGGSGFVVDIQLFPLVIYNKDGKIDARNGGQLYIYNPADWQN